MSKHAFGRTYPVNVTPGRRFAAATVAVWGAATAVLGPTPEAFASRAPDPVAFTLRYSANGWTDLRQAGGAQLACEPACADGTTPAAWTDVDDDPATFN